MAELEARGERNYLLIGTAAVLILLASVVAVRLWYRAADLDERLARAQAERLQLEERVLDASREASELRKKSSEALARAGQAELAAEEAALETKLAELEREIAGQRAAEAEAMTEEARAAAAEARREYEKLRDRRMGELKRMQEALAKIVETERTPLGMVMRLGEDSLHFDFDKAAIREGDKELLSRIAGVLLASHGYRIYVYGHTDDQGDPRYNEGLSERRAQAVMKYFQEAGVPADIMEAKGYGQSSPRAEGTSAQARAQNRRVEIGVIDTVIEYEDVTP